MTVQQFFAEITTSKSEVNFTRYHRWSSSEDEVSLEDLSFIADMAKEGIFDYDDEFSLCVKDNGVRIVAYKCSEVAEFTCRRKQDGEFV